MKCPECGKDFSALRGLISHLRWKHDVVTHTRGLNLTGPITIRWKPIEDFAETIRRVKSVAKDVGGLNTLAEIVEVLA